MTVKLLFESSRRMLCNAPGARVIFSNVSLDAPSTYLLQTILRPSGPQIRMLQGTELL